MIHAFRNLALVPVLLAAPATAQVQVSWSAFLDGTNQSLSDSVADIALGPDDATYVAGLAYTGPTDVLEYGALIAKVDANGQLAWKRVVDAPHLQGEAFTRVAVDAAGNAVVVGTSADSVTGPPTQDFLLRFDALGNLVWRHDAPAASIRYDALAIGPGGEIYVGGSRPSLAGPTDAFVTRFSANGAESWTTRIPGAAGGPTRTLALEVDALGRVYAAGEVGLVSTDGVFVAKLDGAFGALLFVNQGPEPYTSRRFRALALAPDGSTAVTVRAESGGISAFELIVYDAAGVVRNGGSIAGQPRVAYSEGADVVFSTTNVVQAVGTVAVEGPGYGTSGVMTTIVSSSQPALADGIAADGELFETGVSIDRDPDGGAYALSAAADGPQQAPHTMLVSRVALNGLVAWTKRVSSPFATVVPREILVASDGSLRVAADWSTPGSARDVQVLKLEPDVLAICEGDGSAQACPCGNAGQPGSGCADSTGSSGRLEATGVSSLLSDSLVLRARHPSTTVLYFQGTSAIGGGQGAVFGDGLRCAGGTVTRIAQRVELSGFSRYPMPGDAPISVAGGVAGPGERVYQLWYRNAATFCTPSTFNLTNGLRVRWTP